MIMKSDVLPFSNSTKTGDPGQLTGDISGAQVTIDLVKMTLTIRLKTCMTLRLSNR